MVGIWQRVVLMSASRKLRRLFRRGRVCHLLITALCSRDQDRINIWGLRLDFLLPSSPVEVRLEVSVSQHQLCKGKHPVKMLFADKTHKQHLADAIQGRPRKSSADRAERNIENDRLIRPNQGLRPWRRSPLPRLEAGGWQVKSLSGGREGQ